jgi:hypothetical protein
MFIFHLDNLNPLEGFAASGEQLLLAPRKKVRSLSMFSMIQL